MIVKFHNRGTGCGSGPIDYLLGKDRQRELAMLERGDPDLIRSLIDSSKYAKKYTSGVLSFAESDLPREAKDRLMSDFEKALLPGLESDQYAVLWVEHRDKGRLELNFVVPNIELLTGKRLQPYFHSADQPRIDAWRTMENGIGNFHDPDDPQNRQGVITAKDLPHDRKQAAQAITDGLLSLAAKGLVMGREDVVSVLKESGFDVVRQTPKSISIAAPDGGVNIRLKGVIYEQSFRHGEGLRAEIEAASERYRTERDQRIQSARASYQRGFELKLGENFRRYKRPESALALDVSDQLALVRFNSDQRPPRSMGGNALPRGEDNGQCRTDCRTGANIADAQEENLWNNPTGLSRGAVYRAPQGAGGRSRLDFKKEASHQTEGERLNDRTGDSATQRLGKLTERAREALQRARDGLQRLASDVRAYIGRESGNHQALEQLDRSAKQLEAYVIERRVEARSHSRGR